jgi:hypothetical protein
MRQDFAIKSKFFSLYQAFREEAEKAGWLHNADFNPFTEEKSQWCDCLFFCTSWRGDNKPMFSFSNSSQNVFRLPEQWDEAVDHMRKVVANGKPKEKVTVSLKDLAEHHGVEVSDLIITA